MCTRLLAFCLLFIVCGASQGQEIPTVGLLYNTKDWASLDYECLRSGDTLSCEFTQVGIHYKMREPDFAKRLEEAKSRPLDPSDPKSCADIARFIAAADGRGELPKGWSWPRTDEEKLDAVASMKAVAAYCEKPNRENLVNIVRIAAERDRHTCVVWSSRFKQIFSLVSDGSSRNKSWVVKSAPQGACGTVQLDRFELETVPYSPDTKQWRYVARKAVTNPSADKMPGMKCSDLDEDTYIYTSDITFQSRPASCSYTEFSVF